MLTEIVSIAATAVLSSLLTLALAARYVERRLRPRLEEEIERRLLGAAEKLGDVIRERVRQGVLDAVADLPAPNLVREAGRSVARTAGDLMQEGLGSLLGTSPRRREGE